MRYALIVVEGAHDRAFIGRILEALGLKSFREGPDRGRRIRLKPFWNPWIPTYPKGDNLYRPLDMVYLWENAEWPVGVKAAGGDEMYTTIPAFLESVPDWMQSLANSDGAFAVISDADAVEPAVAVAKLRAAYAPCFGGLPLSDEKIREGSPRVGAFVLPNHVSRGTVESLLLPLGNENSPELVAHAENFVDGCPAGGTEGFNEGKVAKAKVAAVASILQPGSTNAITIEKDALWLTPSQLDHPVVKPLVDFLRALLAA